MFYMNINDSVCVCQVVRRCWVCCPQNCHAEKGQEWADSAFVPERDLAGRRCPGTDPDFRAGGTGRSAHGAGELWRQQQGDISFGWVGHVIKQLVRTA